MTTNQMTKAQWSRVVERAKHLRGRAKQLREEADRCLAEATDGVLECFQAGGEAWLKITPEHFPHLREGQWVRCVVLYVQRPSMVTVGLVEPSWKGKVIEADVKDLRPLPPVTW
jgi:hypothetical protein